MRTLLLTLLLVVGLGVGLALELPEGAELLLSADDTLLVGSGRLSGDRLELELLPTFQGRVRLLVFDRQGGVQAFDAVVDDGEVILLTPEGDVSLQAAAAECGAHLVLVADDAEAAPEVAVEGGGPGEIVDAAASGGSVAGAAEATPDAPVSPDPAR